MGGIFWEDFFGRNFLGGFFGGGFFLGGIFWEELFGRNSLFTLLKLFEYERDDLFVKILVFVKILSQGRRDENFNL